MYIVFAALSSAALTLVLKWFRDPKGTRYGLLLGNYLTCTLIAFIQMPDKSRFYSAAPATLLMSAVSGFLYVAGLVCMQTSVRVNGAALSSAFSKLGISIPLLMSFGLTEFSVSSVSVLKVRKCIAKWTKAEADALTEKILKLKTASEVKAALQAAAK